MVIYIYIYIYLNSFQNLNAFFPIHIIFITVTRLMTKERLKTI
jgi:hypothetical protein